jgi:hypothetical protein
MKNQIRHLITILAVAIFCLSANAQITRDTTPVWKVETLDDYTFIGRIAGEDANVLRLETENFGTVEIKKNNIRQMSVVNQEQMAKGQFWPDNPYATRYFWAPNGYGLRKGEGYYQNTWIFFNQVSYGFSDYFSMGVGTIPMFLFGAAEATPIWLTPKFSIPVRKDKFNLGAGVLAGTVLGEDTGIFGIAYGTGTIGSRDKNLTLGLGYGFVDDEWASTPAITLSGMLRTGKRWYLLSENYFIGADGENVLLLSFGARWAGDKISIDFGGFTPAGEDIGVFFTIPWLGINVPFGRR